MEKEEKCCDGGNCGGGKKLGAIFAMILMAVLLGTGIITYLYKSDGKQNIYVTNAPQEHSVFVSGDAKTTLSPDTAAMRIGVEAEAKTAAEAQTKNAEIMDKVKKSIKDNGVNEDKIKSVYFYTEPVYKGFYVCPEGLVNCSKDDRVWEYKLTGYRTSHSLSVKTDQLETVGKILDSAADAGANLIDNVVFTLSEKKAKEIKQQLLTEAVLDAKTQAEKMATASGAKLGKPIYMSESYYAPTPIYYDMNKAVGAAMEAAPSTSISQGTVDVSVSVSVTYGID